MKKIHNLGTFSEHCLVSKCGINVAYIGLCPCCICTTEAIEYELSGNTMTELQTEAQLVLLMLKRAVIPL